MTGNPYGGQYPGQQRVPANHMAMGMTNQGPGGSVQDQMAGMQGPPSVGPMPVKANMAAYSRRQSPYPNPHQYMQNKRAQFPNGQQVGRKAHKECPIERRLLFSSALFVGVDHSVACVAKGW